MSVCVCVYVWDRGRGEERERDRNRREGEKDRNRREGVRERETQKQERRRERKKEKGVRKRKKHQENERDRKKEKQIVKLKPSLPDLSSQDNDLDLVSIAPVQKLVALHRPVAERLRSQDRLGQVLRQGQPHLLLHLGQPLVDPRVLDRRHRTVEQNFFALRRCDAWMEKRFRMSGIGCTLLWSILKHD